MSNTFSVAQCFVLQGYASFQGKFAFWTNITLPDAPACQSALRHSRRKKFAGLMVFPTTALVN